VTQEPAYLSPYRRAAQRHGDAFPALLWASPATQAARFDAIARSVTLDGLSILDAGCGRADLLDFLHDRGVFPSHYLGIEAIDTLAFAALRKRLPNATILHADFLHQPQHLEVGADVIIFSGSLNTLSESDFYRILTHAFTAARRAVVFNFLSSPHLAAAEWLTWHDAKQVLTFCRRLWPQSAILSDYLQGDSTIVMNKHH
jgi:hypothetical protein